MQKASPRDVMRDLVRKHGLDREKVCRAYVSKERSGEAPRKSAAVGVGPEAYALALWTDGIKRDWL